MKEESLGMAIGIAMTGTRCVAEIQFADYIFNTVDLLKLAGNNLWASHGGFPLPLSCDDSQWSRNPWIHLSLSFF